MPTELQTLEDVKAVRALLSEPTRWTGRTNARNARGQKVAFRSDEATCWCIVGAMRRVTSMTGRVGERFISVCSAIAPVLGLDEIIGFNDSPTRKHHEILAYLDAAIARLENAQERRTPQ